MLEPTNNIDNNSLDLGAQATNASSALSSSGTTAISMEDKVKKMHDEQAAYLKKLSKSHETGNNRNQTQKESFTKNTHTKKK